MRFEEQQSAKQAASAQKPGSLTVRRSGSLKRSVFVTCTAIIRRRWPAPGTETDMADEDMLRGDWLAG
ncbi:hypothetical protein RK56_000160 [Escherichia coli]|nr:hypothetical protein RK56_000160 [Escherichia coli]